MKNTLQREGQALKNKYRKIAALAASALMLAAAPMNVCAAEEETFTVTVVLEDSAGSVHISGEDVELYRIAVFDDYKKRYYQLEEDFVPLDDKLDLSTAAVGCTAENTELISEFIEQNDIEPVSTKKSDTTGKAEFGEVESGIYLVSFADNEDYLIEEFMLEAPAYEDGEYIHDVVAKPKFEPIPDDSSATDSSSSSVTDSRGGGGSSSGGGDSIPQTGQNNLPIPILLVGGVTLVALGVADSKRSDSSDHLDG